MMVVSERLLPIYGTLSSFSFVVVFSFTLNSLIHKSRAEGEEAALVTNIPDELQKEGNTYYAHCSRTLFFISCAVLQA